MSPQMWDISYSFPTYHNIGDYLLAFTDLCDPQIYKFIINFEFYRTHFLKG